MKNTTKLIGLLVLGLLLSFFTLEDENIAGEYGGNGRTGIKITLNSDNYFFYKDYTDNTKRLKAEGEWKRVNNKIYLRPIDEKSDIIKQWKLVNDNKCLKARKHLAFYTLCDCK